MDLFSLFRSSPEKQIERARKKVREPHGDPATRMNGAHRLAEMGTPEALLALLDRFTINVSPSSQDEQEKEEVLSWIIQMGEKAVPPLVQFLKRERQVYWAVRALRETVMEEEFADPPASSDPTAQLIRLLGVRSSQLVETATLFLGGEADDVRLAALDYLFDESDDRSRELALECYLDSEDRPRVRNHILERFAEEGWSVKGFRPKVEDTLPEGYTLTRDGKVRPVGSGQ
jgi:HEAT repeat protein